MQSFTSFIVVKNCSKSLILHDYERCEQSEQRFIQKKNIWIIMLKMANFKGWFFARKLRVFFSKMWLFFRYFQPLWKKWNFACIFKKFRFFRITKAQFQLQGWPLRDEDLDQRVKSCFNQVWILHTVANYDFSSKNS